MKLLLLVLFFVCTSISTSFSKPTKTPYFRQKCENFNKTSQVVPEPLKLLREAMAFDKLNATIITSDDEHQSVIPSNVDERRAYITGFTGSEGVAVVTGEHAALWTDYRYLEQADQQLSCFWDIISAHDVDAFTVPEWISRHLSDSARVGAFRKLVPHFLWEKWSEVLRKKRIFLIPAKLEIIDDNWKSRPKPSAMKVYVHEQEFAGKEWYQKVEDLRHDLHNAGCDAIVLTSLTEIAWLFNIRGYETKYTPVPKAFAIISNDLINLYTNEAKLEPAVLQMLKTEACHTGNPCVRLFKYEDIYQSIRTLSQPWRRVLLPSQVVFDNGVSEEIYSSVPQSKIEYTASPIIARRAVKNKAERAGMRYAHILDAIAMCQSLQSIEEMVAAGQKVTEMDIANDVDRSRMRQESNKGLSFATISAYGPHGALPHYEPSNATALTIGKDSTLVIDSGGQYNGGTTDVTRTIHMGKPTEEQITAYTKVLAGQIDLAMLVFPGNLHINDIDLLARSPQWKSFTDYGHGTGHGIGSMLSVHESPINVIYSMKQKYRFKEGYFFSNEPGYYKSGDFGIRLENILEVVVADENRRHEMTDTPFLKFREATLVPYQSKLINTKLLTPMQIKWLNEYNNRIRTEVGAKLKELFKMKAFHWMMDNTIEILACGSSNNAVSAIVLIGLLGFSIILPYIAS